MEKYDCQVIAEIGIRKGLNFTKMIRHNPKMAVAIDVWKEDGVRARNDLLYSQKTLDGQYGNFVEQFGKLPFVKIYREYSFEAVKRFPNEFFDLVYIDADHTFEGCYRDIIDWYPKIKKGKFLLGDDFINRTIRSGVRYGVVEAVTKFARENSLSFFVFQPSKWGMIKI